MQKKLIILSVMLCILVVPLAYAQTQYVVLTPNESTSSFNPDFNQTAVNINTSLANNSAIVYFDDADIASANTTIASHNPDYVFLVMQPQNATPALLDDIGDMLKTLDSDPFVDVAWGVITGETNTSAWALYNDRTLSWTNRQYAAANAYQPCSASANNIYSRFTGNSKYNYNYLQSPKPNQSYIITAFQTPGIDLFYFCTNITDYNQHSMYDTESCFYTNETTDSVQCGTSIGLATNTLFLSDTSESGRISGNVSSPWMRGQNNDAAYDKSFPVNIISKESAGAIIAPYSTRWPTAEGFTKNIMTSVTSGSTLGNALLFAKNALLLNRQKEAISNESFIDHIEKEYILYGKPNHAGTTLDNPYSTSKTNVVLQGASHKVNETLLWNATLRITPAASKYNKIYDSNSWSSTTLGTVWYKNITSMDLSNSVNITFVATLAGRANIHDSVKNIILTEQKDEANITKVKISANKTATRHLSNTTEAMNATLAMADSNYVHFALLYSPNTSLSTTAREINITFNTTGISENVTAITATYSNTTASISLENPTAWAVANLTVEYIIPENITTACVVAGMNCSITDNTTDNIATFTIPSLAAGTTNYNLKYLTTISANASVSPNQTHDRGDNIQYETNITSIENATLADINTTLYDPDNKIVWTEHETGKSINDTSKYYYNKTWNVDTNATPGQYAVELVVTDNNTEKIIYSRTDYITITDQLVFEYNDVPDSIGIAYTENPNALNWTFFKTTDSINITGTIKDKNNNTVQGASVNATLTGSGTDMSNTTNETGAYEIGFSWNSIAVGTKTLTITANDTNNNTATYIQTIYISNYANKTTVSLDRSIYEYNTENVTLTVNVLGASDEKVYLAEVTVSGDYSATKKTDENGVATFIFPAPKEYTLSFSINAKSPLNTSLTLQNSTSAYSVWLYYENITITPENPKVGQTITIAGEVYVKGNKTGCGSGSVNIKVYKGAFSKNITDSTLNSNEFSKEFEYGTATSGKVPFEPGTWYYALDGSISSCIVRERTFTSLTADDPSTKSDDFTITSNSTTTTSSGDDDDDSTTTDTTSSSNEETCTQNSDCSSGDYCLNSVCTAISCDDGVIVDHQCISAYKIDISENPEPFFVEQGTSKSFEFTVKNTGYKNLTNITGSLIAPETLLLENWYSMTELKSNLAVDEQNKSTVQITVPETESIKAHTIKIKIVSAEKTQEKNMTLQVTPGEKEQRLINSSLNMLTTDIADTEKDIETLMKKLGNSNTTTAKTKLDTVKKLHAEALEAISTGDYLTAYHKKQEINSLMQDIRAIVTDGQASIAKSSSLIKTVFLALFSIAAIGALFYYLWVPAPNEYANSGNYGRIPKKSTNPFIAKIKAQVDNVVNEYKKQKETEANAPQKYNFHKKKRWSK